MNQVSNRNYKPNLSTYQQLTPIERQLKGQPCLNKFQLLTQDGMNEAFAVNLLSHMEEWYES